MTQARTGVTGAISVVIRSVVVAVNGIGAGEKRRRVARDTQKGFSRSAVLGRSLFPPTIMLGREHPEYWRIVLRTLLRDASYLPDPVARRYMHDWVIQRFRIVGHRKQTKDTLRALDKTARATTQLLRKAQVGRLRSLTKVLYMSYGRTGRRRHELLAEMLAEPVPADTEAVRHVVTNKKTNFGDDWQPPAIVMALLKSQINNPEIQQRRPRAQVKTVAPSIPSQNSWGQPVPHVRKVNLRQKWYQDVLDSLLPTTRQYSAHTGRSGGRDSTMDPREAADASETDL